MKNIIEQTDQSIFKTYSRYPVVLTKGEGVKVWDEKGKQYLDFLSGIAVCNLGHSHPGIVKPHSHSLKN